MRDVDVIMQEIRDRHAWLSERAWLLEMDPDFELLAMPVSELMALCTEIDQLREGNAAR